MTGPRRLSHDAAEELISASLTGDLTDGEAADLASHLAACDRCTATAAAWADSRRVLSGVRHMAAPRDLGARVRTGIERGRFAPVPWWRRPSIGIASAGALAAAALVMAVIIGLPKDSPPVASSSPLPTGVSPAPSTSGSPVASLSPVPTGPVSASPEPSLAPAPPDYRIEYAFNAPGDISQGSAVKIIDQTSGAVVRTLAVGDQIVGGAPVDAQLSPDGTWLALRIFQDAKGTEQLYAVQLNGGAVTSLGETLADPFAARLQWSPEDGRYLAFTLVATGEGASPAGSADVFIFEPNGGEITQVTASGDTYVGSWRCCGSGGSTLWVSRTEGSYPLNVANDAAVPTGIVPGQDVFDGFVAHDAFVPLFSPDGTTVIFWQGVHERTDFGARFPGGGTVMVTSGDAFGQEADARQPLLTNFADPIGVASIAWGADSDGYAVWGVGRVDSEPDGRAVYFGHLSREGGTISNRQRLEEADLPDGAIARHVAIAPDGRHLAITASFPIPGELAQPVAELVLVTRNYDDRPDETQTLGPADVWVGPGIYAP